MLLFVWHLLSVTFTTPLLLILIILTPLIGPCLSIEIKNFKVPLAIRDGNPSGVLLDCEYELSMEEETMETDPGLVVKWFLNNDTSPVYQWIPGQPPQDLGLLKGRVQLDNKVSDNPLTMYRAIFIQQPTKELSGIYKCCVSTFDGEDYREGRMVVFSTGKGISMHVEADGTSIVNVTCSVQHVFPEPHLNLYIAPGFHASIFNRRLVNLPDISVIARSSDYDIFLEASIKEIPDPDVNALTIWCELFLPEADNYTENAISSLQAPIYGLPKSSVINSGESTRINYVFIATMFYIHVITS